MAQAHEIGSLALDSPLSTMQKSIYTPIWIEWSFHLKGKPLMQSTMPLAVVFADVFVVFFKYTANWFPPSLPIIAASPSCDCNNLLMVISIWSPASQPKRWLESPLGSWVKKSVPTSCFRRLSSYSLSLITWWSFLLTSVKSWVRACALLSKLSLVCCTFVTKRHIFKWNCVRTMNSFWLKGFAT